MYIAEHIQFKLRSDLSVFHEGILESLFIQLTNQKSLKIKNMLYKNLVKKPSTKNISRFKQYRNKLHHLIRISKESYYEERFEQSKRGAENCQMFCLQ